MSGIAPEEEARAAFYGLLARLFYAPADAALLSALGGSGPLPGDDADAALAVAWLDLTRAAASASLAAVEEEYESVFIGTGKAEVSLYTSAYTVKSAVDNPLVEIRDFMDRKGLQRKADAFEPEDHFASVCEIMRSLVVEQQSTLKEQQAFFESYVGPGGLLLCDAINRSARTVFYRHAANLAKAFLTLEQESLDMH